LDIVQIGTRAGITHFVFDGYHGYNILEFVSSFLASTLQTSLRNLIYCTRGLPAILETIKKKLEVEELSEEQVEEITESYRQANNGDKYADWSRDEGFLSDALKDTVSITLQTGATEEETVAEIKRLFAPRVILVNHEKRLTVDTTCANLAIKYNFIYISVYQTIKQHIENNTDFGKRLLATKKPKSIKL
jgi:hypothetical protein